MHTDSPTYIGSAEVCERLGIDKSTLSRWVAAGKLSPAHRIGKGRGIALFDPADVDALTPPTPAPVSTRRGPGASSG
jgi:excisionase family DNA binding protein